MAKALFIGLPMHGHTNPSLPLVKELVRCGEEVVYFSTPAFKDKIEAEGAAFRPYANRFLSDMSCLPERLEQIGWLLMRTTWEVLEHELDAIRREKPDYLIVDSVAPWGQWIGEILNLPVVTSISTFAFNRHVLIYSSKSGIRPKNARVFFSKLRYIAKSLRLRQQIRRRYQVRGLDLIGLMSGRSGCNIVYTSREFQPCSETFDSTYHFIGPSTQPRIETESFPWTGDHQGIIYVSLGTLFNINVEFYQLCFHALAQLDRKVVISIGAGVSPSDLGVPPSNTTVHAYVPQLEALERASLFVSHGGMNSVSESLFYGVPVIAIPQMSEQALVGNRVKDVGAGACLNKDTLTAKQLEEEVRRLLDYGPVREQAQAIRQSFLQSPGVAAAADIIRQYAGAN